MTILLVGGAGYIGSHMVRYLLDRGFKVAVLDNFSTGHRDSIPTGISVFEANLLNFDEIEDCFSKIPDIEAVMHFAALSLVGESVKNPELYYRSNLIGALNLLTVMHQHQVRNLVFSSTAAVYGNPTIVPIPVSYPANPVNPYGQSKLMIESILKDYATTYGFRVVTLRYFNAAGADVKNNLGERHSPETHLIPLLLEAIKTGGTLNVYGNDYETRDGTCLRDYIHVLDLCEAHALALKSLKTKEGFRVYNLGTQNGISVLEIIKAAEQITQQKLQYKIADRRPGDPAILVADPTLTTQELGWCPVHSKIEQIIADAWAWCKKTH